MDAISLNLINMNENQQNWHYKRARLEYQLQKQRTEEFDRQLFAKLFQPRPSKPIQLPRKFFK